MSDRATKRRSDEGKGRRASSSPSSLRRSVASSLSSFHLPRLRAEIKPFRLHYFPRLRSTSTHAAEMRKRGDLYAPAVVLTSHQTAGRGRGEHTWWSHGGVLTVTFAFPVEDHLAGHHVPLIAGRAVRDAAAELSGDPGVQLKWPNDVLVNRRKLAGLLCERVQKVDLIGVGLNVNVDPHDVPPALRERVISLSMLADGPVDMTNALLAIARHLRLRLMHRDEQPFGEVLREYDNHHALLNQRITVITTGTNEAVTGTCEGLDTFGRLLLRTPTGLQRIIAGEVRWT